MMTSKKHNQTDTVALHRAVYAARPAARETMATSPLANPFITAAQEYQVSLLAVATKASDYWRARAAFAQAAHDDQAARLQAEDALVRSEIKLCETSPALSEKRIIMLASGKAYMRSTPKLALMLDLPPTMRVWNHMKLLLKR